MKYYKKNSLAVLKQGEIVTRTEDLKSKRTKAMALIWAGVPEAEAWKQAGFKNPSKVIGSASEMRQIREKLNKAGVTPKFIADMMMGWLMSEDPKIQISGYEKVQKIFDVEASKKETPSRRITLEEFINHSPDQSDLNWYV